MLLLLHPEVGQRSCEDCRVFEFNHKTGEQVFRGRPQQAVRRPACGPGSLPPCLSGIECAKGRIGATFELSAKNWQAFNHYRRCKATGHFPDDPIVARNAAAIAAIERVAERRNDSATASLAAIARHLAKT